MINKLDSLLSGVKTAAVSGHIRPDGDCVGSCLATYNYITTYYPEIQMDIYLEPIPNIFKFMDNSEKINSDYPEHDPYDLFIAQDCGDLGRLGKSAEYFEKAKKTLCIDHHISNSSFADENYIFPEASSTCELVYELLDEKKINKKIAECIYTGMVHDTGVFQYSCTSAKTMNIAGILMDKGIPFTRIIDNTFYEKTFNQNHILGQALIDSKLYLGGQVIATVVTAEEMERFHVLPKHLEGIVSQLRSTKGVDAAIFIYENEDHTFKISMRSAEVVDCAEIAMKFGGGGHVRAAGATMEGKPDQILDLLIQEMKKQLIQEI